MYMVHLLKKRYRCKKSLHSIRRVKLRGQHMDYVDKNHRAMEINLLNVEIKEQI